MDKHESLYSAVFKAIADLFSDASVSPDQTKRDLESLKDEIEARINCLGSAVQRPGSLVKEIRGK